jgi:3-oxoacyl-[acyl-carrier-protein] synthase-3
LHSRLLLRESCGALDVGGACAGLIYGFAIAKGLLIANSQKSGLVVASEVHSRRLTSPSVPAEFCGLFGDGACAFLLGRLERPEDDPAVHIGHTVWGCSGTFSSSLRLMLSERGEVMVDFEGKDLAGAAITQLDRVLQELQVRSGRARSEVDYFALHQPNPRITEILAQRCALPLAKIPTVSRTYGNLGSVTCGASLCDALTESSKRPTPRVRPVVFMAAVAPGLIWGGSYLH